jgi:hypothetical protein
MRRAGVTFVALVFAVAVAGNGLKAKGYDIGELGAGG